MFGYDCNNCVQVLLNTLYFADLKTKEIIGEGRVAGKLYILDSNCLLNVIDKTWKDDKNLNEKSYIATYSCNTDTNKNKETFSLWHKRLGHSSQSVLNYLKFIPSKQNNELLPCIPCYLAKQKRLPFLNSESHADDIFKLIHVDLWGPYKTKTISGASYFLTIVDDHSKSIWTFLLKDKTQVQQTLTYFFAYVTNQFSKTVKVLRTDNGSEFVNHKCQTLLSQLGIIHQKTVSYSPQQNGRVERKHQQLLQIARAFLSQSNMPITFWGHAILMATHIINILPTPILEWKTPYKCLHNKDPSYSSLKTFGCLCFATNVKPHKTKFAPRVIRCCFIGYNPCQKAYKLYDLEDKKVIMSRDVVFYESIFPFIDSNNPEMPIPNPHEEPEFNVNIEDFIPADDYNPDDLDLEGQQEYSNPSAESTSSSSSSSSNSPNTSVNDQNVPKDEGPNTRPNKRVIRQPSWFNDCIMHCTHIPGEESKSKVFTSPHSPPTYPYIESPILT